jgi:hypothetical protein
VQLRSSQGSRKRTYRTRTRATATKSLHSSDKEGVDDQNDEGEEEVIAAAENKSEGEDSEAEVDEDIEGGDEDAEGEVDVEIDLAESEAAVKEGEDEEADEAGVESATGRMRTAVQARDRLQRSEAAPETSGTEIAKLSERFPGEPQIGENRPVLVVNSVQPSFPPIVRHNTNDNNS